MSAALARLPIHQTMVDQVARLVYSAMAAMAEALRLGFLLMEMLAVVVMLAAAAAWAFLGFQQQYYQHLPWTLSRRGMAPES
jgi:type II secretory pathway pseudopilin PulG